MGSRGREIVGLSIDDLLTELNKAFADEWLAHYQYWMGAKVAKGPMKEAVIAELTQHAADEARHADMIALRIIQLGGTPLTTPTDWMEWTNCGYDAPNDPFVGELLTQNIKGEQCAIDVYTRLLEMVRGKDDVTYNIVLQILSDEVMHEEELQSLEEDLNMMMGRK